MKPHSNAKRHERALCDHALSFPESREEFPWGERVVQVRGKIFVFLRADDDALSVTTKLPTSHVAALDSGFTEPTGYGLGKSGWVTARFGPEETPPLALCSAGMEESYRAVAPKRLLNWRAAVQKIVPLREKNAAPPQRRVTKTRAQSATAARAAAAASASKPKSQPNPKLQPKSQSKSPRTQSKARSVSANGNQSARPSPELVGGVAPKRALRCGRRVLERTWGRARAARPFEVQPGTL